MHRDSDSAGPEHVLLEWGFRPEHLTPLERVELAERLRIWPEPEAPARAGRAGTPGDDRREARVESPERLRT